MAVVVEVECYDVIINAFFTAGSAANLDLGCLKDMHPPPFYVGP